MAQNITIMGASYPDVPAVVLPTTDSSFATFYDVGDTTASAADVTTGKLFYASDGTLASGANTREGVSIIRTQDQAGGDIINITGTIAGLITPILMRPDTTIVHRVTYDKYIITDEKATWPGYTTTSTPLKATENLTTTVSLDYENYNYYIIERAMSIPIYNIDTIGKGRVEYSFAAAAYEIVEFPANTFTALINSSTCTSRSLSVYSAGNALSLIYWSNASTLTRYSNAAYGVAQTITAPAATTAGVLTLKTPVLLTRGHTSYFTQTYMDAVTDVRYQWVFEVYRAPKNNLSFDGWTMFNNSKYIVGCADSSNHTLA